LLCKKEEEKKMHGSFLSFCQLEKAQMFLFKNEFIRLKISTVGNKQKLIERLRAKANTNSIKLSVVRKDLIKYCQDMKIKMFYMHYEKNFM
jgi:hypothetical protein